MKLSGVGKVQRDQFVAHAKLPGIAKVYNPIADEYEEVAADREKTLMATVTTQAPIDTYHKVSVDFKTGKSIAPLNKKNEPVGFHGV